jgi:hypothetical protein
VVRKRNGKKGRNNVNTIPANFASWSAALQRQVIDAGVPCGLGGKPETVAGQPWVILSVLSTLHDGDIAFFDTDQNVIVQAMCVGFSPEQASAVYWRADSAITGLDTFDGGVVIQRWRDGLTGPTRDDRTFPNSTVYSVAAAYRLWLAPSTDQET